MGALAGRERRGYGVREGDSAPDQEERDIDQRDAGRGNEGIQLDKGTFKILDL